MLKSWRDHPVSYGEYYAVDVQRGEFEYIFGYRHAGGTRSESIWGELVDSMSDNERCILVKGTRMSNSKDYRPELFRVYDLELIHETGSIRNRKSGRAYLEKAIGTDKDVLRANSPVRHLDKLKIPVLIVHGGEDKRVPVEHAQMLKKRFRKTRAAPRMDAA